LAEIGAPLAHLHQRALRHWPGARVAKKVNAKGELVVALILPERMPGEWTEMQRAIDERAALRRGR
jgi:hypothetical protein